jgi:hypothetical protein
MTRLAVRRCREILSSLNERGTMGLLFAPGDLWQSVRPEKENGCSDCADTDQAGYRTQI